jgi:hypothetical protein
MFQYNRECTHTRFSERLQSAFFRNCDIFTRQSKVHERVNFELRTWNFSDARTMRHLVCCRSYTSHGDMGPQ